MAKDDWCRRKTWTEQDKLEFYKKLKRCKKENIPNYLREQANSLFSIGTKEMIKESINLLNHVIKNYPAYNDKGLVGIYISNAHSFIKLKQYDEAIQSFRLAIETSRAFNHTLVSAHMTYGLSIVELRLKKYYGEILALINEFGTGNSPFEKFQSEIILAIIKYDMEQIEESRIYALKALNVITNKLFDYYKQWLFLESHEQVEILIKEIANSE